MVEKPKVYYEPAAQFGSGFHCQGVDGNDYTLCGFSLDGQEGSIEEVKSSPPRVDCPQCLAVIYFCRKLSARTFASPHC